MNLSKCARISHREPIHIVHLSEIIYNDTLIHIHWHNASQTIMIEFQKQLYSFTLPGVKSTDLTVRQIVHALGLHGHIDVLMDSSKAFDYTRDDILDGDCWNTIDHQLRIIS